MSVPNIALERPEPDAAPAPANDLLDLMRLEPPLSAGARLVYITLLAVGAHDDAMPPTLPEIARLAGVGERSLARWLVELRARGLVRSTRRGQGKTQLYQLTRPAQLDGSAS